MKITEYIDTIISNNLDHDHWFTTKQYSADFYFPYYIASIVDTYANKHYPNEKYDEYYNRCFSTNRETSLLYPGQDNYRNTVIPEFIGLVKNDDRKYASASATEAYHSIHKYVLSNNDIDSYRELIDHQIEKMVLNVLQTKKYSEVSSVTIFPTIFLYKVLFELYKKYGDSKLNYSEFLLFVFRAKSYEDYKDVIDLIEQFRNHDFPSSYDDKILHVINHVSSQDCRLDGFLGLLSNLDYKKNVSFRIVNEKKSYKYIASVIAMFEKSSWKDETNKTTLLEFMRSDNYFTGKIDNVSFSETLPQEEFELLVTQEDDFLEKLKELAKKYGEDGTTDVLAHVRLSSVQKAFRDKLIEMHGQNCAMCGVTNKELLIASHIKAAASSNIHEKADYQNGFLLCAIHDKLFDKFFISFNFYDGKILISPSLTEYEKETFKLDPNFTLPKELLTPERINYLMWHNEQYYKKEENR